MASQRRVMVALLLILSCLCTCRQTPAAPARDSADVELQRQIVTVSNMRLLNEMITAHREDHGKDPARLDGLVPDYAKDHSMMTDGWGRKFYYYSNGDGFVLASFGKAGIPRNSDCEPGCIANADPDHPFESNIVMINGKWAQTPAGVDR